MKKIFTMVGVFLIIGIGAYSCFLLYLLKPSFLFPSPNPLPNAQLVEVYNSEDWVFYSDMVIYDEYVYIVTRNTVTIWSFLQNKPEQLGEIKLNREIHDLNFHNGYLYIVGSTNWDYETNKSPDDPEELFIFSLADPLKPELVYKQETKQTTRQVSLLVYNDVAYLTQAAQDESYKSKEMYYLYIFDVSNPEQPVLRSVEKTELGEMFAQRDGYIYAQREIYDQSNSSREYELQTVDVTSPYNPQIVSKELSGYIEDLMFYEDRLIVANYNTLFVLDITVSPWMPLCSFGNRSGIQKIWIGNEKIYLVKILTDGVLEILDIILLDECLFETNLAVSKPDGVSPIRSLNPGFLVYQNKIYITESQSIYSFQD